MSGVCRLAFIPALSILLAAASPGQEAPTGDEPSENVTAVVGDWLLSWRSAGGTTVTYRGIPVLGANPSEFVVHQKWQKVLYRSGGDTARGSLVRDADRAVLTIRDENEHFRYEKTVTLGPGSVLSLDYAYEILEPQNAEIQVLYALGRQWLDGSDYRIVTAGGERTGKLEVPATGRIDPWGNATQQEFATSYGSLAISADRPLNLLCVPTGGDQWWADTMEKGAVRRVRIDMKIEPGPEAQRGVVLHDLRWPGKVRTGECSFHVTLSLAQAGPEEVEVRVERAGGGPEAVSRAMAVKLAEVPAEVECPVPLPGRGTEALALVIAHPGGEEILRLAPLMVETDPYLELFPRLSLYTTETEADIVARVADDLAAQGLTLQLVGDGAAGDAAAVPVTGPQMLLPVPLVGVAEGEHRLTGTLRRGDQVLARVETGYRKLPPRDNEVKIDHISGGLIADGLPCIPFGYYTYWPLAEGVMDGEVVRGFSLFSPYHGGPQDDEKLQQIRAYLDRCAQVGMRVNYHLVWTNRPELSEEQWASLRREVEAFRDHPALLSWYIADEPSADRAAPLTRVYRAVRELDPYHPVSIVFYQSIDHARLFSDAMDIVMGDPYPIPGGPVTRVSETTASLRGAFGHDKTIWIVPQCFGGGEGWKREPTAREQRVMTYLALLHGARGIQYFIRKPPSSFPKSPEMWAECSTLALEAAELTPALCSSESAPDVSCDLQAVHTKAFSDRGLLTIVAVNADRAPALMHLQAAGVTYSGPAQVLFEDRQVQVQEGAISEPIDGFGTRVYAIPVGPLPEDDLSIDAENRIVNPSFEDNPSVGTPAGNYANIPSPATSFIDSRVARHGRHSLRLTAPADDVTPSLSLFPIPVEEGKSYRISAWARAREEGVVLKFGLGDLGSRATPLTTQWQEISFVGKAEKSPGRVSAGLGLGSKGVAWVDLVQVVPVQEQD